MSRLANSVITIVLHSNAWIKQFSVHCSNVFAQNKYKLQNQVFNLSVSATMCWILAQKRKSNNPITAKNLFSLNHLLVFIEASILVGFSVRVCVCSSVRRWSLKQICYFVSNFSFVGFVVVALLLLLYFTSSYAFSTMDKSEEKRKKKKI